MHLPFEIFKKDPDKAFIVNYAPIFANLTFLEKNLIIQKSKVVEYKKGDVIYKQFSPPDAFYCVITGRVRIISGGKSRQTLEYLNCGKYFGIISVLTGEPHSVNAEAANDSKILRISKEDFQVILNKVPRLAIDLSQTLSRRLRKKDTQEKKVFESNIISVFSAVPGIGRTMYALNLSLSLKKETAKFVILINISKDITKLCNALGLEVDKTNPPRVKIDGFLPTDSDIKAAILKEPIAGISILNIKYDQTDKVSPANLNALLTQLTSDFHFIIVDLPALMDELVFSGLSQSDSIHIITDYDSNNLTQTKSLISDLFHKVNYPEDKIKLILNARREDKYLSGEQVSKLLDYNIYASLPLLFEDDSKLAWRIAIEQPNTEYAQAIRRIAREVGDVRVGLALSGGAALGLVHIGIIKVLEREKIPIDVVIGSSMGALIGAIWAVGFNGRELERILLEYNNKKRVFRLLFDPCFPKLSFFRGKRIRSFLDKYMAKKTFQDIKFPLKIVACNISKRQEVLFDSGNLTDAVMASIAIPGVFPPTKINGNLIIDSGIIEPVPVGSLVRMGIKKIIAVNVLPSPENIEQSWQFNLEQRLKEERKAKLKGFWAKILYGLGRRLHRIFFPNILDIIVNSIQTMEYVIAEVDCQKADAVLRPYALGVDWFEFFKVSTLINKGEEEANKSLAAIKSLVSE